MCSTTKTTRHVSGLNGSDSSAVKSRRLQRVSQTIQAAKRHMSLRRDWEHVGTVTVLLLLLMLLPCVATAKRAASDPQLRALIISPAPSQEPATGIAQLLSSHHIKTITVSWSQASKTLASQYDVLIIAGPRQWGHRNDIRKDKILLGLDKPLLAVGQYGCSYLGLLELKNGYPYT